MRMERNKGGVVNEQVLRMSVGSFFKQALLLLAVVALCSAASLPSTKFVFKHHDNNELAEILYDVHKRCPNITRVYALSLPSVEKRPLLLIEFSTKPGHHQLHHPEVKYIANMHGNEVLGRELILKFADHLCERYLAGDTDIRKLISLTRIHLMPTMNPDGWELATGGTTLPTGVNDVDGLIGRNNAHNVDLNRNFPDLDRIMFSNELAHMSDNHHLLGEVDRLQYPIEPEVKAVMRLIMQVPFVLSANMHGGDLVANYPYDASRSGAFRGQADSPDDETFKHLAQVYASSHADMASPVRRSCGPEEFGKKGGITNGAAWYSISGSMQDFNYLSSNDFEITLELGCDKYPPADVLEAEWLRNKDALIQFLWQAHIGVKGDVRNALTREPIANALIHVRNITNGRADDIEHDITSVHQGDYWRLLTPGEYEITAVRDDYEPQTLRVFVTNQPHQEAHRLDFRLRPRYEEPLVPWSSHGDLGPSDWITSVPYAADPESFSVAHGPHSAASMPYPATPRPYPGVYELYLPTAGPYSPTPRLFSTHYGPVSAYLQERPLFITLVP